MKDKVYVHLKTGNSYIVREELEMKCPVTDEWLPAVLYQSLDTGVSYVRGKISFHNGFAQKMKT